MVANGELNGGAVFGGIFEHAAPGVPLAVTTSSLPPGTVGAPYSAALAATGGAAPYTWSITSASPPAWLSLNPSTGALSGTPTTSGSQNVTFKVTDSDSISSSVTLPLTVFADPGVYVPLTPTRICDTRANNPSHLSGSAAQCSNGTTGKTLAAGGTLTFDVAGDFSVPASNVTAVVLSVATANSKGPGHFTLFPAGADPADGRQPQLRHRPGGPQPGRGGGGCRRGGLSVLVCRLRRHRRPRGLCDHHPPVRGRSLQRPHSGPDL